MKTKKNLFAVTAGIICCVVLACFSPSLQGGKKKYEIHPQVTFPAYGTDSARTLDAYERLMEHYIVMAEKNLAEINFNIKSLSRNLTSVNKQLAELSQRMARIEKAFGIEETRKNTQGKKQYNEINKKKQNQY